MVGGELLGVVEGEAIRRDEEEAIGVVRKAVLRKGGEED